MYHLQLTNFPSVKYSFTDLTEAIRRMSITGYTSELYQDCEKCGRAAHFTHRIATYHPTKGFSGTPKTEHIYRSIIK